MKTYQISTTVTGYSTVTQVSNAKLHVNGVLGGVQQDSSYSSWCLCAINFEDRGRPDFAAVLRDSIEAEPDDYADKGANPSQDRSHAVSREIVLLPTW